MDYSLLLGVHYPSHAPAVKVSLDNVPSISTDAMGNLMGPFQERHYRSTSDDEGLAELANAFSSLNPALVAGPGYGRGGGGEAVAGGGPFAQSQQQQHAHLGGASSQHLLGQQQQQLARVPEEGGGGASAGAKHHHHHHHHQQQQQQQLMGAPGGMQPSPLQVEQEAALSAALTLTSAVGPVGVQLEGGDGGLGGDLIFESAAAGPSVAATSGNGVSGSGNGVVIGHAGLQDLGALRVGESLPEGHPVSANGTLGHGSPWDLNHMQLQGAGGISGAWTSGMGGTGAGEGRTGAGGHEEGGGAAGGRNWDVYSGAVELEARLEKIQARMKKMGFSEQRIKVRGSTREVGVDLGVPGCWKIHCHQLESPQQGSGDGGEACLWSG